MAVDIGALAGAATAAVADPFAGEVFAAADGGARLHTDGGEAPLTPRGDSRLVDIDLDQRPMLPGFEPLALLADADSDLSFQPRVTSTSLALTWVAAGRRAAYLTDGELSDNVHFAAGVAICLAAGCEVSDLHGRAVTPGSAGSRR